MFARFLDWLAARLDVEPRWADAWDNPVPDPDDD